MRIRLFMLLAVAVLLLPGCTRKIYVPVEREVVSHVVDSVSVVRERTDTVIDRDTVRMATVGDTVYTEVTRWRYRLRERIDTVWRERADTLRRSEVVTVPPERRHGVASGLMAGLFMVVLLMGAIAAAVIICKLRR